MTKLIITTVCCLLAQLFMPVNAQTWDKTIGKGEGKCIIQTYDGGYIVGGGVYAGMGNELLIYKIDNLGNIIYSNNDIYIGDEVYIESLIKTYDSNYLAVSTNYDTDEMNFFAIKLDYNLDILWTKQYGYTPDITEYARYANSTYDSNYVIIGQKSTEISTDIWLIKININGDTLWTKRYGKSSLDETGEYIIPTIDSGFLCGGIIESSDLWILKLNAHGDTVWTKKYANHEHVSALIQLNDSSYIVGTNRSIMQINKYGGILWDSSYNFTINAVKKFADDGYIAVGYRGSDGSETVKMTKLNESGNVLWSKSPNNLYYSQSVANDVVINDDQGFTITGYNTYGFWVARLDSMGNGLDTTTTDINKPPKNVFQDKVKIHPNPFKDKINIEINDKKNIKNTRISILNSKGMIIMQKQFKDKHLITLDTSFFLPGVYICKVEVNNKTFIKKLIKQ
jgi:hypothetical protein